MDYKIELTEQPAQLTLSKRTRTSVNNLPQEIGKAYEEIMQYLNELGVKPLEAPFAAYYNMDMEDLDVEMGFIVDKEIPGKGDLFSGKIPGGKQASCYHKGPYAKMDIPYNAMMEWLEKNKYEATGVAYEFYYNSPMDVPESELLTKIVFPVK